jgi:putative zinc finger/helix-turn-helix YgiT family protein
MKCPECGNAMRVKQETVSFEKTVGVPGVWIVTDVARCPKCGSYEVIVQDLDGLHRAIARTVINKEGRLSGAEIRFLRKLLGWSGADFAEHMGTSAETVSRWETDSTPMGPQADRLLRLMVLTREPVANDDKLDMLKGVTKAKGVKVRMTARSGAHGWKVTAA